MLNKLLVVAVLIGFPAALAPQELQDTLTAREAAALVRRGNGGPVTRALRQVERPRSAAELDALADSLVRVVREHGPTIDGQRGAISAAVALVGAAREDGEGVRYPRAFGRLVQMFHQAPDVGVQAAIVPLFAELPEEGPATRFLGGVAASEVPAAHEAVRVLYTESGPLGKRQLRQVFETGVVRNARASEFLTRIARLEGWTR